MMLMMMMMVDRESIMSNKRELSFCKRCEAGKGCDGCNKKEMVVVQDR